MENSKNATNRVNVSPKDMKTVVCVKDGCGGTIFEQNVLVNSVSGVLVGTPGRDKIVPIPVFCCKKCGTPLRFNAAGKPIAADEE